MNGPRFHRHAEDCNPRKVDRIRKKITADVDQSQANEEQPFCFHTLSFYSCVLFPFQLYPEEFQQYFRETCLDLDMKDDLERAKIINWCRSLKPVFPLRTTADGNCLLHAVSLAMWGIEDKTLFLRRLLYITLTTDPKNRFKQRWLNHQRNYTELAQMDLRLNTEEYTLEWENVIKATEDVTRTGNYGLPYTALESIHLYVLANILRRTIIVLADPRARNVFGQSLQESHIGGIYLPLEWNAAQCEKTPILISYSMNHFAPLVGQDNALSSKRNRPNSKQLFPLVTDDLTSFTIQYLLADEESEAGHLLTDYLRVDEAFDNRSDTMAMVLCAQLQYRILPEDLNIMTDMRQDCERKFRAWIDQETGMIVTFPAAGEIQVANPPGLNMKMNIAPAPKREETTRLPQQDEQLQAALRTTGQKKCITLGCKMYGNPEFAHMCWKCFTDYTLQYQKQEEAAKKARQKEERQVRRAIQAAEQYTDLSIMGEECHGKCGFRCSTATYPYCHECNPNKQPVQQPPPPQPLVAPSMMTEKCQTPNCEYYCSEGTYPYCHECYERRRPEIVALQQPTAPSASIITGLNQPLSGVHPSDDEEQLWIGSGRPSGVPVNVQLPSSPTNPPNVGFPVPTVPPSNTADRNKKCKKIGCQNDAVQGNNSLCDSCYNASLFGEGDLTPERLDDDQTRPILGRLDNVSLERLAHPSHVSRLCFTTNCEKPTAPRCSYCQECFIQHGQFPAGSAGGEYAEAPAGAAVSHTQHRSTEPFNSFSNNLNKPTAMKGEVLKSSVPPSSSVVASRPSVNTERKYLCTNPGCEGIRTNTEGGYCVTCLQNQGQDHSAASPVPAVFRTLTVEPTQPLPTSQPSQHPNIGESLPSISMSPVDLNAKQMRELVPIIYSSKQKTKCAATVCNNMIYPPKKLCDSCSDILEKKHAEQQREKEKTAERPYTAPLASTASKGSSHRNHTAPLVKKSTIRCGVEGCDRYGDPSQDMKCAQHFMERKSTPVGFSSGTKVHFNFQTANQRQEVRPAGRLPNNISVPSQNRTRPASATQETGSGELDQFQNALLKVETSRKSTEKCKNYFVNGCRNYGNSSKNGYCNGCYREVAVQEQERRKAIAGQTQFG